MTARFIAIAILALTGHQALARECWALTDLDGQSAFSAEKYVFQADTFSRPMVLCFDDEKTGTVSGDDTHFVRFGKSTLVGVALNKGIELAESYQIDRVNGKVLFTKSRIGTATAIPGGPDVVSAFVGKAMRVSE